MMTTSTAFWRLFPASLFAILGVLLTVLWRSDPVLMSIGACGAGAAASWLIITTVVVAKRLDAVAQPVANRENTASLAT
jgi:hypothetical protein